MTTEPTTRRAQAQEQKIQRVCDYIAMNLDNALSLEVLSAVAACSRFHFLRLFSAYTGMSLSRFVTLARLKRAAYRLAFEPDRKIIDLALEAGFDSPEAFARAFKRHFEQTPSQFRQHPDWPLWHRRCQLRLPPQRALTMDVKIVELANTPIAYLEHRGDPRLVMETVQRFIAWRKATGLSPIDTSQTFGIPNGDPDSMPADTFRFKVAGSIEQPVEDNVFGVQNGVIPGGRCAVVIHQGSLDRLSESIYWLYQQWLVRSGEQLRDYPCYFRYLNFIHEVDECDLRTEIYLPLQ